MTKPAPTDVFQKNPAIAHRVVDGSAVLVSPKDATMFTLNEVGTLVWSIIDGKPLQEIAEKVTEEFDVELGDALEHIQEFIGELSSKELVQNAASSSE